jgi:anti-sigma factor RsiW
MNCERIAEELSAYLDGELQQDLAFQVETHLNRCPSCTAELHSLRDAATVIAANVPEIELRPEIWHNVRARVANRPASVQGKGWLEVIIGRRSLAAAAAAAIALTIGIWGYSRYQSAQQELSQYMNQYIRARDLNEDRIQSARNPFSVVNFSPEENPFRSEDR